MRLLPGPEIAARLAWAEFWHTTGAATRSKSRKALPSRPEFANDCYARTKQPSIGAVTEALESGGGVTDTEIPNPAGTTLGDARNLRLLPSLAIVHHIHGHGGLR